MPFAGEAVTEGVDPTEGAGCGLGGSGDPGGVITGGAWQAVTTIADEVVDVLGPGPQPGVRARSAASSGERRPHSASG